MKSESEMQAKIAIAAALIAAGTYDMATVHMYGSDTSRHLGITNLTQAVTVIYNALLTKA